MICALARINAAVVNICNHGEYYQTPVFSSDHPHSFITLMQSVGSVVTVRLPITQSSPTAHNLLTFD
jgi:hypothetical protein